MDAPQSGLQRLHLAGGFEAGFPNVFLREGDEKKEKKRKVTVNYNYGNESSPSDLSRAPRASDSITGKRHK